LKIGSRCSVALVDHAVEALSASLWVLRPEDDLRHDCERKGEREIRQQVEHR
jgi:hypothetical protein